VETGFKACENPANAIALLQDFDNKLKRGGLNPGTSADLTVASLLAFHLDHLLGSAPGITSGPITVIRRKARSWLVRPAQGASRTITKVASDVYLQNTCRTTTIRTNPRS